jgi:hypothetical protein
MPMPRLFPPAVLAAAAVAVIVGASGCSKQQPPASGTALTQAATTGAGGTGSGTGTGTGTGTGSSGGTAPSGTCKCTDGLYCGYADGQCGKELSTPVCLPVWNPASCMPAVQACGCDGKVYESRCAAALAGVDTNASGGCKAPSGYFACGASFCQIGKQYCRLTTGSSQVAPFCAQAPLSCSSKMGQGGMGGMSSAPTLSCECILEGDKDCPKCEGSADAGFTASGCQGK